MIPETNIEYQRLESAIELLNEFLYLLSDGYNPTTIAMKRFERKGLDEDSLLRHNVEETCILDDWDSKKEVEDLEKQLVDNFDWLLEHLKNFSDTPQFFQVNFRINSLNRIIKKIRDRIVALSTVQTFKQYQYYSNFGDGSESKHLLLLGKEKAIYIEFGLWIH